MLEPGKRAALGIAVDMTHPCDINFFRAPIRRWQREGHDVRLLYLDRGRLRCLIEHEYPGVPAERVGRHAASRLGLYLRTGLWREAELLAALRGQAVDVVVGFPGFQTAMVAKLLGLKSLGAYDDPEHRPNMVLSKLFCDVLVLPQYLGINGSNIETCRALKEWAYLAPRYFTPNPGVLGEHGLSPQGYIFLREVEPRSHNYRGGQGDAQSIVEALYHAGLNREKVVLSLEDKRRQDRFTGWQVLQEPVSDIHSLMYYSALVASNGDSMAREGAQLGVPSVYLGRRSMKANDALYAMGLMRQLTRADDVLGFWQELSQRGPDPSRQAGARARLTQEWEDPVDVLCQALSALTAR